MRQEQPRAIKAPRPPKQPKVEDFQFFPPRLFELLEKEVYAYRNQVGYKVPKEADREWTTEDEQARRDEQDRINVAIPLSDEEVAEKDALLEQGCVARF